jgi:hypothetical protein
MDNFDVAITATRILARGLIAEGIDADAISDVFITEAMAVFAAGTGRREAAEDMLRIWVSVRDAEGAANAD